MSLSPASQTQLYYKRTPFAVTLNLTNAANVGAYQFRLTWNPSKLQWVSSSLPAAAWLASTGRPPMCAVTYDTPPWPTFTPTSTGTRTATPTGTPPTNTPSPTSTATPTGTLPTFTPTPTPAGNITFGCGTLGTVGQFGLPLGPAVGDTPVAIANFQFMSIATVETGDILKLTDVGITDVLATPIVVSSSNANVRLARCYDMDGDGVVSILDLTRVSAHFGATIAVPVPAGWIWVPLYDIDGDGAISILDLVQIASEFGMSC